MVFRKRGLGDLGSGLSLSSLPVQVEEKGVIAVSSKNQTVLFQDENGSLFGFGHGDYGKLGHNSKKNHHTPTMLFGHKVLSFASGGQHGAKVIEDGSLWTFGKNNFGSWVTELIPNDCLQLKLWIKMSAKSQPAGIIPFFL